MSKKKQYFAIGIGAFNTPKRSDTIRGLFTLKQAEDCVKNCIIPEGWEYGHVVEVVKTIKRKDS